MPRTSSTNPPYSETVAKYVKETNSDPTVVATEIAKYGASLGMSNMDFVAWHWVKKQGLQPPPLNQAAPFTVLDKPYISMAEGLKIATNTGYTIRGYFIKGKLGSTKKGNDMFVFTMVDESGARDVLVFGDKVKTAADFAAGLKKMDKIRLTSIQTMAGKDQPRPALSGGVYTGYTKIVDDHENVFKLPKFTEIAPTALKELEVFETALVRGLSYSYEIAKYTGCPNCKTKFRDNTAPGRPAECNDREYQGNKKKGCGIVTATEMAFTTLVVVDQRFDVKLKFDPDQALGEDLLRDLTDNLKPVWAVGSLQKNDTFRVDWYDLESNLGGPNVRTDTGTGLSTPTPVSTTPTVPAVTPAPVTTTTPLPSVTANPYTNQTVTITVPPATPPYNLPSPLSVQPSDVQKLVDEDLMEYMNVFQTASMEGVLDYFNRRSVPEEKAKTVVLEAIMQKKIAKDGNTIRKVPKA